MTRVMSLSVLIVLIGCGAPSERDVGFDAPRAPVDGGGLDADQAETTITDRDTRAAPSTFRDITDTLTPPNADIDDAERSRIDAPQVGDSRGGDDHVDSSASPPPLETTDAVDDTHALVDGVVEDTNGDRREQPQEDTTETHNT